MGESELAGFALLHHVAYLDAMASEVPHDYATQEVNHLTLVHFAVAGLSLLRELDRVNKEQIINWVLSFQIHPESNNDLDNGQFYGFCGSRTTQFPANNVKARVVSYDVANIDSKALLSSMKKLQQPDGSQATDGGFQGRRNKPNDTCYAFWVGGVLKIIGAYHLIDHSALRNFLLTCQSACGGFKKNPDDRFPDIYHSYYGLAAFSLLEERGLEPLCVELGILSAAL